MASQDALLTVAVKRLPQRLQDALLECGMADAVLPQSSPRYTGLELGLQTTTGPQDDDVTHTVSHGLTPAISLAPVIGDPAACVSMDFVDTGVFWWTDGTLTASSVVCLAPCMTHPDTTLAQISTKIVNIPSFLPTIPLPTLVDLASALPLMKVLLTRGTFHVLHSWFHLRKLPQLLLLLPLIPSVSAPTEIVVHVGSPSHDADGTLTSRHDHDSWRN